MFNHIILSSSLFGSIYILSTSLILINKLFLEYEKPVYKLIVLNGVVFVVSGFMFICASNLLKL